MVRSSYEPPMRKHGLVAVVVVVGVTLGFGTLRAQEAPPAEEHHEQVAPAAEHAEAPAPVEEHHEAAAPAEHQEPAPAEEHHEAAAPAGEHHDATAEHHETTDSDDADDAPTGKFDLDGNGKPDLAVEKEYEDAFAGEPNNIFAADGELNGDEVDQELDARPADGQLKPSMTIEQFRKVVRIVKKVVLGKMEKKMAKASAKKMGEFSTGIAVFSLLGLLLLAMPLALRKKYPGQGKVLMKYSALAAIVFLVTVNLMGGVLRVMKTVQGALGEKTNPSLAIASGTFDTLDRNAEQYAIMGKELFAPTLEQLSGGSDEQPSVLILENGQKVVAQAKVFVSVAKMFKKVDFIFSILPIVLFGVTMLLFALAIRPTLTEIIKLPMRAASGEAGVGREVSRRAMKRVWGELLATLGTLGALAVLTVISSFVLGEIVGPALDALLGYFALAVSYLQFVPDAHSGLVFLALFGVILFLVLNLAALILSMSFFLGKTQKIFQARFNDGVPVATHKRFFQWGIPSVLFVQIFPWLFVFVAERILAKIDDTWMSPDAHQVAWTKILVAGPALLVGGFAVLFWAARGVKAIRFLQAYKVKPAPVSAPSSPAEPV